MAIQDKIIEDYFKQQAISNWVVNQVAGKNSPAVKTTAQDNRIKPDPNGQYLPQGNTYGLTNDQIMGIMTMSAMGYDIPPEAWQMLSGMQNANVPIPKLKDLKNDEFQNINYTPKSEYASFDYNINPNELYKATNYNPNIVNNPNLVNYTGDVDLSQIGPSELRNILSDPDVLATQKSTLQGFNDITQSGGMTDIDRAKLAEIQNQINNQNKANQESILLSNRQRNMGNSGGELASQLLNQQASANQANQMSLDVNAQAQARALQTLSMVGDFANQMNSQQFQQQAQKAQAQDMINQFNTQNTNEASLRNANLRQQLAGTNAEIQNQLAQYNNDLLNQGGLYNAKNMQSIANQNADKYANQNLYNTQNWQNTSNQNVNLKNQAALMNTQNRQDILNQNTDLRNQSNMYNVTQKPLTQYGLQTQNADMVANSLSGAAQMQAQKEAAKIQANAQKQAALYQTGGNMLLGGATIATSGATAPVYAASKTGKS